MRSRDSSVDRSRRWFLRTAAALGAVIPSFKPSSVAGAPADQLGTGVSFYGNRSRFERTARSFGTPRRPQATASFTPLADSYGIITPSSLHFERHHSGVPDIDPAAHTLTVHGLVDRPLVFTVADVKRLPSVSRVFFVECSGNSSSEWRGANAPDVQRSHGLTSCSEWTGAWLGTLLRECGIQSTASWALAEGADAARVARSIPIAKALDNVLVAYAQNGEPLRPEQGYPLRLVVPGWEGITNVKWLHRIKLLDGPAMTRWETAKYTDLLPDGTARMFTFEMEAKSVITRPSGGQTISPAGVHEISGLAWSGRGAITRVEVSVDGGGRWVDAALQSPVHPLAHTRFRHAWRWDGRPAIIASRATDDTGYVQPGIRELIAARGVNSGYHNNAIQPWSVSATGVVANGL